jgi:hypothetical protein
MVQYLYAKGQLNTTAFGLLCFERQSEVAEPLLPDGTIADSAPSWAILIRDDLRSLAMYEFAQPLLRFWSLSISELFLGEHVKTAFLAVNFEQI